MALTAAERQARHRERVQQELEGYRTQVREFLNALADACELGRCAKFTNHLPEEPHEALAELKRRLETRRIIVCCREE